MLKQFSITGAILLTLLLAGEVLPQISEAEKSVAANCQPDTLRKPREQSAAAAAPRLFSTLNQFQEYRIPLDVFKYDTSKENAEHRCYEIIKPISKSYNFAFNLILIEKFTTGGAR
jgi:hypothetical protein